MDRKGYVFCGCQTYQSPGPGGESKSASAWEWGIATPRQKSKRVSQSNPIITTSKTHDMAAINKRYSDNVYEPINPPRLYGTGSQYMSTRDQDRHETGSLDGRLVVNLLPDSEVGSSHGPEGSVRMEYFEREAQGIREGSHSRYEETPSTSTPELPVTLFTAGLRRSRKDKHKDTPASKQRPLTHKPSNASRSISFTPEILVGTETTTCTQMEQAALPTETVVEQEAMPLQELPEPLQTPALSPGEGKPESTFQFLKNKATGAAGQVRNRIHKISIPIRPKFNQWQGIRLTRRKKPEEMDQEVPAPDNLGDYPDNDEDMEPGEYAAESEQTRKLTEKEKKLMAALQAKTILLEAQFAKVTQVDEERKQKAAAEIESRRQQLIIQQERAEADLIPTDDEPPVVVEVIKKEKHSFPHLPHLPSLPHMDLDFRKKFKRSKTPPPQTQLLEGAKIKYPRGGVNEVENQLAAQYANELQTRKLQLEEENEPKPGFSGSSRLTGFFGQRRVIPDAQKDPQRMDESRTIDNSIQGVDPSRAHGHDPHIFVTQPSLEYSEEGSSHSNWRNPPPRSSSPAIRYDEEEFEEDIEIEDSAPGARKNPNKFGKLGEQLKGFGMKSKAVASSTSKGVGAKMKGLGKDLQKFGVKVNEKYQSTIEDIKAKQDAARERSKQKAMEAEDVETDPLDKEVIYVQSSTEPRRKFRFRRRDESQEESEIEAEQTSYPAYRTSVPLGPNTDRIRSQDIDEARITRSQLLGRADRDWESPLDLTQSREVSEEPFSADHFSSARDSPLGSSLASSTLPHVRKQGVMQEIDSDEFFLREKGISEGEDEEEINRFLLQELKKAFRPTIPNALAQFDQSPPPRRPEMAPNKPPRRGRGGGGHSPTPNYQTFPPERPKRKTPGYVSSYMHDQEGEIQDDDEEQFSNDEERGSSQGYFPELDDEGVLNMKDELRRLEREISGEELDDGDYEDYEPVNKPVKPQRTKKQRMVENPERLYYNTVSGNEWVTELEAQIHRKESPKAPQRRNRSKSSSVVREGSQRSLRISSQSEERPQSRRGDIQMERSSPQPRMYDHELKFKQDEQLPNPPPRTFPRRKKGSASGGSKGSSLKRGVQPPTSSSFSALSPRTTYIVPPSRPHRSTRPNRPPRSKSLSTQSLASKKSLSLKRESDKKDGETKPSTAIDLLQGRALPPPPPTRVERSQPGSLNDLDPTIIERAVGVRRYADLEDEETGTGIHEEVFTATNIRVLGAADIDPGDGFADERLNNLRHVELDIEQAVLMENYDTQRSESRNRAAEHSQSLDPDTCTERKRRDERTRSPAAPMREIPPTSDHPPSQDDSYFYQDTEFVFPRRLQLEELEVDVMRVHELRAHSISVQFLSAPILRVNSLTSTGPLTVSSIHTQTLNADQINCNQLTSDMADVPSVIPRSFYNLRSPVSSANPSLPVQDPETEEPSQEFVLETMQTGEFENEGVYHSPSEYYERHNMYALNPCPVDAKGDDEDSSIFIDEGIQSLTASEYCWLNPDEQEQAEEIDNDRSDRTFEKSLTADSYLLEGSVSPSDVGAFVIETSDQHVPARSNSNDLSNSIQQLGSADKVGDYGEEEAVEPKTSVINSHETDPPILIQTCETTTEGLNVNEENTDLAPKVFEIVNQSGNVSIDENIKTEHTHVDLVKESSIPEEEVLPMAFVLEECAILPSVLKPEELLEFDENHFSKVAQPDKPVSQDVPQSEEEQAGELFVVEHFYTEEDTEINRVEEDKISSKALQTESPLEVGEGTETENSYQNINNTLEDFAALGYNSQNSDKVATVDHPFIVPTADASHSQNDGLRNDEITVLGVGNNSQVIEEEDKDEVEADRENGTIVDTVSFGKPDESFLNSENIEQAQFQNEFEEQQAPLDGMALEHIEELGRDILKESETQREDATEILFTEAVKLIETVGLENESPACDEESREDGLVNDNREAEKDEEEKEYPEKYDREGEGYLEEYKGQEEGYPDEYKDEEGCPEECGDEGRCQEVCRDEEVCPEEYKDEQEGCPEEYKDEEEGGPEEYKDEQEGCPEEYKDEEEDRPEEYKDEEEDRPEEYKDEEEDRPEEYKDEEEGCPEEYKDEEGDHQEYEDEDEEYSEEEEDSEVYEYRYVELLLENAGMENPEYPTQGNNLQLVDQNKEQNYNPDDVEDEDVEDTEYDVQDLETLESDTQEVENLEYEEPKGGSSEFYEDLQIPDPIPQEVQGVHYDDQDVKTVEFTQGELSTSHDQVLNNLDPEVKGHSGSNSPEVEQINIHRPLLEECKLIQAVVIEPTIHPQHSLIAQDAKPTERKTLEFKSSEILISSEPFSSSFQDFYPDDEPKSFEPPGINFTLPFENINTSPEKLDQNSITQIDFNRSTNLAEIPEELEPIIAEEFTVVCNPSETTNQVGSSSPSQNTYEESPKIVQAEGPGSVETLVPPPTSEEESVVNLGFRLGHALTRLGARVWQSIVDYVDIATSDDPSKADQQKVHIQVLVCVFLVFVAGILLVVRRGDSSSLPRWNFLMPPADL